MAAPRRHRASHALTSSATSVRGTLVSAVISQRGAACTSGTWQVEGPGGAVNTVWEAAAPSIWSCRHSKPSILEFRVESKAPILDIMILIDDSSPSPDIHFGSESTSRCCDFLFAAFPFFLVTVVATFLGFGFQLHCNDPTRV